MQPLAFLSTLALHTLAALIFTYSLLYFWVFAILVWDPGSTRWREAYLASAHHFGALPAVLALALAVARVVPRFARDWLMAQTSPPSLPVEQRLFAAMMAALVLGVACIAEGESRAVVIGAVLAPPLGAGFAVLFPSAARWLCGRPGRRRHRWSLVAIIYLTFLLGAYNHPAWQNGAFLLYSIALWTGSEEDPWRRWSLGGAKGRELLARMQAVWGPLQPVPSAN